MKLGSYEFLGVIVPGVIVTYGFALMFPELSLLKATEKVSFGEVGLMLVLAFVAGQLLQALGNLIEEGFQDVGQAKV
jgi:ABC-type Fe3+ transport system permease subunit